MHVCYCQVVSMDTCFACPLNLIALIVSAPRLMKNYRSTIVSHSLLLDCHALGISTTSHYILTFLKQVDAHVLLPANVLMSTSLLGLFMQLRARLHSAI